SALCNPGRGWGSAPAPPDPCNTAARAESIRAMVNTVANDHTPGMIVIGTAQDYAPEVLKAVRRHGIKGSVMATGGAGTEGFLRDLATEPEERERPGF